MRTLTTRLKKILRLAAAAVAVSWAFAAPTSAAPAAIVENGRPILVACRSAATALRSAGQNLRAGEDYLPLLDTAQADVNTAMNAAADAEWPRRLRHDRFLVRSRLVVADRALERIAMPGKAGVKRAHGRLVTVATRNVVKAAKLLELIVPAPPPLTNKDAPPAPVISPPVVATPFTWTDFTPSADTQMVYVSSSEGSDTNDGLTETTPVKTISKGYSLLRDGYPDWLRLKRGDTWVIGLGVDGFGPPPTEPEAPVSFQKSGRSSSEKIVVSSYGTGERPYLKCNPTQSPIWTQDPPVHHVAFVGLNFKSYTRDPNSSEFTGSKGYNSTNILYAGDILIEDCRFSYYKGLVVQSSSNIALRGCVLSDCYAIEPEHSGGVYTHTVTGLLVESCYFIRNGWCPGITGAEPTKFNRNLYLSDSPGAVVRDCIDADGASGGTQLRLGGVCERNLFVRNPRSIDFSHPENPVGSTVTGTIRQNVVLGGRDIGKLPMATGISVGTSVVDVTISENIVAHNVEGTGNVAGISVVGEDRETAGGISISNNIVYDWQYEGSGYSFVFFQSPTRSLRLRRVTINDNDLQQPTSATLIATEVSTGIEGGSFLRNSYSSARAADQWFKFAGSYYDFAGWQGLTGDSSTSLSAKSYTDPSRDLVSYMRSIGQTATIDQFLLNAREQCRDNWRTEYTARAVIDYVRQGFGWSAIEQSE